MNPLRNTFRNSEIKFQGKPLAHGITRGKPFLLKKMDLQQFQNDRRIVDLVSVELARLDLAITGSKDQISYFMKRCLTKDHDQSFQIFETMLQILGDPGLISPIRETIERTSLNCECVLAEEIARLRDQAYGDANELTVKRLITMQDLYYRILYNILPSNKGRISFLLKIPAGSILVADRLAPVEVAVLPMNKVVGVLIEENALYSHSSIMARTLGVPVIIDFPGIGSLLHESTDVLIDANRGFVFLNPSEASVRECRNSESMRKAEEMRMARPDGASTVRCADGLTVHLACNASTLADINLAQSRGINEIGLFRSEIRFLSNTVLPSDEQEAAYYAGIFGVKGVDDITVRLLDMGGDKLPVYLQIPKESDPQLGCRGIRFLLTRPGLMKKQVRAILSARGAFRIRLLLPFVTTVDDLLKAREIIEEVFTEMKISGDAPLIGIMVEVPSVALSIQHFLPKVDFVCLGTNDLIQYLFAVNRDQADLQKYNRFTHPAFLKMLKEMIVSCENQGKELTVCGEMASDPAGCCLLAAMGATNLSIQPDAVHDVCQALSKLNAAKLRRILPALFDLESADEVEQKIRSI